jgi:hypothetical protein
VRVRDAARTDPRLPNHALVVNELAAYERASGLLWLMLPSSRATASYSRRICHLSQSQQPLPLLQAALQ